MPNPILKMSHTQRNHYSKKKKKKKAQPYYYPTSLRKKIKILNAIICLCIKYAFYTAKNERQMGNPSKISTICTWQTPNGMSGTWVDVQNVLNKDNLTYEHNLTLVHKFLQTNHYNSIINKYLKGFHSPNQDN